jgi:hypothetical protein
LPVLYKNKNSQTSTKKSSNIRNKRINGHRKLMKQWKIGMMEYWENKVIA